MGAKVGVRNVNCEGTKLTFDIRPVSFQVFRTLADSSQSPEIHEISASSGTSAILFTTEQDGSHKMIVQHRSSRNATYKDAPGPSAAGYFDGRFDRTQNEQGQKISAGRLIPVDSASIKRNILTEISQEIGLQEEDITDLAIVGIAQNLVKIEDEFLLVGTTGLDSEEVKKRARRSPRNKDLEEELFHFEEKFFIVDATVEAIRKLLTEVKSPMGPTHITAFIAAGYLIVLREKGEDAALSWKDEVEAAARKNMNEIDRMVIASGKGLGFEPSRLPQEQGLPGVDSELIRVKLI